MFTVTACLCPPRLLTLHSCRNRFFVCCRKRMILCFPTFIPSSFIFFPSLFWCVFFFFLLCVLCYSCLCTCVFVVVWSCLRQWHESWKETKRTSLQVPADTATSTSGWPFTWVNSWVVRGTVDRNARNCLLELSARQLPLGMSLWTVLGMSGM